MTGNGLGPDGEFQRQASSGYVQITISYLKLNEVF
jgi:hypothetical protein